MREPISAGRAVWVAEPLDGPEQVVRFVRPGGRALTLASNQPYEVWLDGRFVGDGGQRCVEGEALADRWPAAVDAAEVVVRVHWVDPLQPGMSGRLPFQQPFLADLVEPASVWRRCEREAGVRFGVRASGHLTRQTITVARALQPLTLIPVALSGWSALVEAVSAPTYVPVAAVLLQERLLPTRGGAPLDPSAWVASEEAACLVGWATERRPALRCQTFDLGAIALQRFELDTPGGPALVCGSEVPEFERLATEGRGRVALADAVAGGLTGVGLIGQRGCRYVHLLSEVDRPPPRLRAWRRTYPFRWRERAWAAEDAPLVAAARNNLIACVDGGLVDSCWRERMQWTGDMRMGAIALRALADNPEVIGLALGQIADSYDAQSGMVKGAWPSSMDAVLPTYHLAYCLAALEHDPGLAGDPRVRHVVRHSLERWRESYLRGGLVCVPPGWTFTDWEQGQLETMGYAVPEGVPHAVLNAWWVQVCGLLGEPAGVDPEAFESALGHGDGYLLVPATSRSLQRELAQRGERPSDAAYGNLPDAEPRVSPHATAVALASGLVSEGRRSGALAWLEGTWRSGALRERLTPYFGYFVAEAFATHDPALAVEFVRSFYGEEARRLGTISEKGSDADSLAHGWSVAYARYLVGPSVGPTGSSARSPAS